MDIFGKPPRTIEPKTCAMCGKKWLTELRNCPNCGASLGAASSPPVSAKY